MKEVFLKYLRRLHFIVLSLRAFYDHLPFETGLPLQGVFVPFRFHVLE